MANGDIYLGAAGSEYKLSAFGRRLTIKPDMIVREGRTISGKLVRDVISTKHEITLEYELIGGTDLATLITIYNLQSELSLQIHKASGYDSYTVLIDTVSRKRELLTGDGLWSGVTVVLKEV